jgi:hypothetical protein
LLDRLVGHDRAVTDAESAVGAAEAKRRRAARRVGQATAELGAYHEAVAAGEAEADPDREAGLDRAAREALGAVTIRQGPDGVVYEDTKAEAVARGAARALETATAQRAAFCRAELPGLLAELERQDAPKRSEIAAAYDALVALVAARHGRTRRLGQAARLAGRDDLLAGLPAPGFAAEPGLVGSPDAWAAVPRGLIADDGEAAS